MTPATVANLFIPPSSSPPPKGVTAFTLGLPARSLGSPGSRPESPTHLQDENGPNLPLAGIHRSSGPIRRGSATRGLDAYASLTAPSGRVRLALYRARSP